MQPGTPYGPARFGHWVVSTAGRWLRGPFMAPYAPRPFDVIDPHPASGPQRTTPAAAASRTRPAEDPARTRTRTGRHTPDPPRSSRHEPPRRPTPSRTG